MPEAFAPMFLHDLEHLALKVVPPDDGPLAQGDAS
jgi:hypothetical protein